MRLYDCEILKWCLQDLLHHTLSITFTFQAGNLCSRQIITAVVFFFFFFFLDSGRICFSNLLSHSYSDLASCEEWSDADK